MVRAMALAAVLLAAGCSEGPDPAAKADSETPPAGLSAGQWEIVTETMKVTAKDKAPPALGGKAGDKESASACLAEADAAKPAPELIAGAEGEGCKYDQFYMSGGRINASMICKRPGVTGDVMGTLLGSFAADSFDGNLDLNSYLPGSGDVAVALKVSGRRTAAACTGTS